MLRLAEPGNAGEGTAEGLSLLLFRFQINKVL